MTSLAVPAGLISGLAGFLTPWLMRWHYTRRYAPRSTPPWARPHPLDELARPCVVVGGPMDGAVLAVRNTFSADRLIIAVIDLRGAATVGREDDVFAITRTSHFSRREFLIGGPKRNLLFYVHPEERPRG